MPTTSASKTITRDPDWSGPAISPGEMLREEFLRPLGLRQVDAAQRLGISANRLNEVVLGKRRITADTALRLSRMLDTSPQFWMRLQADWDLHRVVERTEENTNEEAMRAIGDGRTDHAAGRTYTMADIKRDYEIE